MSGTYPHYKDRQLEFDTSKAILARASVSRDSYRAGFDVSLPLFGPSHPMRLNASGGMEVGSSTRYFIVFKGKRYTDGLKVGTKTRDSLYKIHNGKDIVLLTTCKHGDDWQRFQARWSRANLEFL